MRNNPKINNPNNTCNDPNNPINSSINDPKN